MGKEYATNLRCATGLYHGVAIGTDPIADLLAAPPVIAPVFGQPSFVEVRELVV